MRFWSRLTLGRIFGGVFCIATLFVFGKSWSSIFIVELAAIYFISEVLVSNLPSSIAKRLQLNCIRTDGSWSDRRQHHENKAVNKLRWDIRVVILLVMIPTTLVIWLFDREVAPVSVGLNVLSKLDVPSEKWKAELGAEEHQFDLWAKRNHGMVEPTKQKQFLWKNWPVIGVVVVAWLSGCWIVIRQMFIYHLKDLLAGIENRKWQYMLADRSRSSEWSD